MKKRPVRPIVEYAMPARDNSEMGVFLPIPCKREDIDIIRKWLDLFEPVLTEEPLPEQPAQIQGSVEA